MRVFASVLFAVIAAAQQLPTTPPDPQTEDRSQTPERTVQGLSFVLDNRSEGHHYGVVSAGVVPAHREIKYTVIEGPAVQKNNVWVGVFIRFWRDELPPQFVNELEVCNESLRPKLKFQAFPEADTVATIHVEEYEVPVRNKRNVFQVIAWEDEGSSYFVRWKDPRRDQFVALRVFK